MTCGVTSSPVILVRVSASKFLAMMSDFNRVRSRTKLATADLTPCIRPVPIVPFMRCAVAVS